MRIGSKPGSRISLGTQDKTVGYDVTYRYEGTEQTIRMDQKPGDRLPVIDGQVVTQTAAAAAAERGCANCQQGKPRGRSDPGPFFVPWLPAWVPAAGQGRKWPLLRNRRNRHGPAPPRPVRGPPPAQRTRTPRPTHP